jgi:alpha-ribazole phosphatase
MNRNTRWWWVRHAPTVAPAGTLNGRSDVAADLSDTAAVAGLARSLPAGAVWLVSPLRRTVATAEALLGAGARAAGDPVAEADLMEQNFGAWEGGGYDQMDDGFWDDPVSNRPPGGESFAEVTSRVGGAIGRWNESSAGRDIVAVAHAGVVRAALALALGGRAAEALRFAIDPLSLTRLDRVAGGGAADESWAIVCVNRPSGAPSGGGQNENP